MTFTLFIVMRNEIQALPAILPRIKKEWVDEILILDGDSTDGSIEYAESLGFQVTRQKSKGLLEGVKEGIGLVRTDYVIGFTPDNNMIPEMIPQLVAKVKEGGYDMVIVSRYFDGAKSHDDSMVSGFGNWFFTALTNLFFGSHYTDVLGYYRAYRVALFKELGIEIKLSVDTQLCIRCTKKKLKVAEIPGDEPKRIGGHSSRSILKNGWIELTTILGEFFIR